MNQHQRLKEYGMYIRKTGQGTYNLGWTDSQRPGGLAAFPTWDDAYEAFETLVEGFWEYKTEDFQTHVESNLYRMKQSPYLEAMHVEREQHREEARSKLFELTKP